MYSALIHVMAEDFREKLFKEKEVLLLYTILLFVFRGNTQSSLGIAEMLSKQSQFNLVVIITIGFLGLLFRGIPLRLCRAIYACPAGDKEKRMYLFFEIGMKMVVCGLIFVLTMFLWVKKIFYGGDIFVNSIQTLLCFFTLLNVNLRIGFGDDGNREVDEAGYEIHSKAENAIKIYWLCALLCEWVYFYLGFHESMQVSFWVNGIVWGIFMTVNLYFCIRYIKPFINEMLSYEFIYCPKPRKEVVQYDI